jgi:hypothetical protein
VKLSEIILRTLVSTLIGQAIATIQYLGAKMTSWHDSNKDTYSKGVGKKVIQYLNYIFRVTVPTIQPRHNIILKSASPQQGLQSVSQSILGGKTGAAVAVPDTLII